MIVCSCQLAEMPLVFRGHLLDISLKPALADVLAVGLVTPSVEARNWMAVGAFRSHPKPEQQLALTPGPVLLAGVQRAMGCRSTQQRAPDAADVLNQQH
jgi:hypothetical protein